MSELDRASGTSAEPEGLGRDGALAVTDGSVEDGDGPVGQRDQDPSLHVSVDDSRSPRRKSEKR